MIHGLSSILLSYLRSTDSVNLHKASLCFRITELAQYCELVCCCWFFFLFFFLFFSCYNTISSVHIFKLIANNIYFLDESTVEEEKFLQNAEQSTDATSCSQENFLTSTSPNCVGWCVHPEECEYLLCSTAIIIMGHTWLPRDQLFIHFKHFRSNIQMNLLNMC